jgi:hypothetical protein
MYIINTVPSLHHTHINMHVICHAYLLHAQLLLHGGYASPAKRWHQVPASQEDENLEIAACCRDTALQRTCVSDCDLKSQALSCEGAAMPASFLKI